MIFFHYKKSNKVFIISSVKVTIVKPEAKTIVDVVIRLQPPEPSPDHPYALHFSATVTYGNLRWVLSFIFPNVDEDFPLDNRNHSCMLSKYGI